MHKCYAKKILMKNILVTIDWKIKHKDHVRHTHWGWVFCIHTLSNANLKLEFLDKLDLNLAFVLA